MTTKNRITLNIEQRDDGSFYIDSDDVPELNLIVRQRENLLEVICSALDTIAERLPQRRVEPIPCSFGFDLLSKAA